MSALTRFDWTFLGLVTAQGAHSVEEYYGRLYEVFAPARFVSGLISSNLQRGFIIFNVMLVIFGLWCFIWPVRRHWTTLASFVWFWVTIELINGVGHPLWSLFEMRYTPGVATAPVLLLLAMVLAWQFHGGQHDAAA